MSVGGILNIIII